MFNPKSILVPTDFSECSENAMKSAVEIAEQFNAKLIVVYVESNDIEHMPLFYLDDDKVVDIKERLHKNAESKLEEFIADATAGKDVEVETRILDGIPYDEIVHLTEKDEFDLLVIASHGRNAIQKFFYGSTTEKVVRSAQCSVMIIRK